MTRGYSCTEKEELEKQLSREFRGCIGYLRRRSDCSDADGPWLT